MSAWFIAVVLGVVEGLTEFLPVSSTGHLVLAGHALGFTGPRADTFEVAIQSGAILAVVILYRDRVARLLDLRDPVAATGFSGRRGWVLLLATSAPALGLGFLAHRTIKEHLFQPVPVALALVTGAVGMWAVERVAPKTTVDTLDAMDLRRAVGIGLFQCLALWPGMSRSASTIVGGMLLGVSRKTAAEYSFFAAIPVITAATAYDLLKAIKGGWLGTDDVPLFVVGFLVSLVSAWAAVRVFIRLVATRTLVPFAVYRIILALVVLGFPAAFAADGG